MSRRRLPTPAGPAELGRVDGLAYSLWLPEREPSGGLVVLHGAGSVKENHHDMARMARDAGLAAVCFDMRGHGETGGTLDGRVLEDVATIAALLPPGPVALRGSSMGGYVAICAAEGVGAAAIVAICPAGAEHLRRGLRRGELRFPADEPAFEAALAEHDPADVVARSDIPPLLLHAEGDETIPAEHSRMLHDRARAARKKLIVVPGGHHRSVQHDPELQGEALRFIRKAFAGA
jgi:pimeloyl-ACP methyl ester carboxylesterase